MSKISNEIIIGLTQGEIVSIAIVAVAAILLLLLISAVLRLGAALMRFGCLMVLIGVFVFTATQIMN